MGMGGGRGSAVVGYAHFLNGSVVVETVGIAKGKVGLINMGLFQEAVARRGQRLIESHREDKRFKVFETSHKILLILCFYYALH